MDSSTNIDLKELLTSAASEDDELANKLERRSQSPAKIKTNHNLHRMENECI